MIKKVIILISLLSLFVVSYSLYVFWYLDNTSELPYRNLLHYPSTDSFIYYDIEHNDSTYTVLTPYSTAISVLDAKANSLTKFAPYYFYFVLKYDISLAVNDTLYEDLKDKVIDKNLCDNDPLTNNTLVMRKRLLEDLTIKQRSQLLYCLLRQGVNPLVADETGEVILE